MRTPSPWRVRAREVIAATLARLPRNATAAERRRAVREAYPFGERAMLPYKMWLKEVHIALGRREKKNAPPPRVVVTPDGVACGWCGPEGQDVCLCCSTARWKHAHHPTDWTRWREWLRAIDADPADAVTRLAFADWLEESFWEEEAARVRREETR
jgi:uncharacterized protein (TIGR02996 family)